MIPFRRLLWIVGGIALVILLNGCQTSEIAMEYTPQKGVTPVTGAQQVPVRLDIIDERAKHWVGLSPAYDYASTDTFIYATNDVVAVLQKSISDELANRGFKFSNSGVPVAVRINSLWGGNTLFGAKVVLTVQVSKSDGTTAYSTSVAGKARSHIFWWDDGKIVKTALDDALKNCLSHLFADPSFVNALLSSEARGSRVTAAYSTGSE